ncbi:MAG: allantoinase [Elusimicrobia bacterium]|nr:MAG: allantoinase [Elusimicrobiota bacterium]
MSAFALRSRRVAAPDGVGPAVVVVSGAAVASVQPYDSLPPGLPFEDLGELAILPGIVDTHAHINEPGRTEWEGFATATRAAAAGGITTVVDMPLNSIPATTTLAALGLKSAAAKGLCSIDYGFWGGVVPGNVGELAPMAAAGALGFKCFLVPSGVDEFPHVGETDLRRAMPVLAKLGLPLLVHAELEGPAGPAGPWRRYEGYLASRPRDWEDRAVALMVRLCREMRCRVHIVHLSSSGALASVAEAKKEGLPFTAETCPHYLTFAAEDVADGATPFKCAPPIRERENREKLWDALRSGLLDMVVSDHSPCTPALKDLEGGDFAKAWGGIAGLQYSLSAVWTGMKERGLGLDAVAHLMSQAPAHFAGLSGRKGGIAFGKDADLVVFDPEAVVTPERSEVLHRHSVTPYCGMRLNGAVKSVYLRGKRIYHGGAFKDGPWGRPANRLAAEAVR